MKPTQKQKAVMLNITNIVEKWYCSEDIDSPTNSAIIDDFLHWDDMLSENEMLDLNIKVTELLFIIKGIK